MNKALVVYNICGYKSYQRYDYYKYALDAILKCNFDKIILSSCLTGLDVKKHLIDYFGNKISYNWIQDLVPVNVSFNHTCKLARDKWGPFDSYIFIDCGIKVNDDSLKLLYDTYKSGPYGMVTLRTNDDSGLYHWFGSNDISLNENFIIPVGKACNLHCQLFGHEILDYYGGLMPDIFASYCTESTFSFLCAALKLNWVVCKEHIVQHARQIDGASLGFTPTRPEWNHSFKSKRQIQEIIKDPVGIKAGLGYEEIQRIMMHKEDQFDEKGFCKNEILKDFIRDNLFLKKDEFDYNLIKGEFVE